MSKPICKLSGTDGNIFALAARVVECLKKAGKHLEVHEFQVALFKCKSYDDALILMHRYVEVR